MKLHLYYVGKPRDAHANAMAEEYVRRIRRYARLEMCEVKPERSEWWVKHASAWKVLLDPAGKSMLSSGFAGMVSKAELEARDLVFVIGGADGLPSEWRGYADLLLSLSAMTFPHELARVVLVEQIYRTLPFSVATPIRGDARAGQEFPRNSWRPGIPVPGRLSANPPPPAA